MGVGMGMEIDERTMIHLDHESNFFNSILATSGTQVAQEFNAMTNSYTSTSFQPNK